MTDLRPFGMIALAGAMVWSTALVTGTYESVKIKPETRTIKVTGSARKRIASDLIAWDATIEAHAKDRTEAYKQLRIDREKAIAFLKAQGIKDSEIQPQSTEFEEEFDITLEAKVIPGTTTPTQVEKRTFKGFVTRESIIVRSGDVPRVEKASREITSLLEEGITITSSSPNYYYTKLGELKVEMLAAAGKDARARATNIIKNAGGANIAKLVQADMGIININPANSTDTSEEGNNDISSFEKDIITIVHAEFELD